MKLLSSTLLFFAGFLGVFSPGLPSNTNPVGDTYAGAWISSGEDLDGSFTRILIVTDRFFSIAAYRTKDHSFIFTSGGSYVLVGGKMDVILHYNSQNSHQVGKRFVLQSKKTLMGYKLVAANGMVLGDWARLDHSTGESLAGCWEADSFYEGGPVPAGGTKAIKVFSDGYFQWTVFDPSGKTFRAAAGGIYAVVDGNHYTEKITFYSVDRTLVGKELSFDCKRDGFRRHYAGLNMAGQATAEVWVKK